MISALALVVKRFLVITESWHGIRLRYHQYATFCEGGVRISSTAVRQALAVTIWLWQKVYWGTRLPSPGVSPR